VRTKAGQGSPLGAPHLRGGIGRAGCTRAEARRPPPNRLRSMSLQAGREDEDQGGVVWRSACAGNHWQPPDTHGYRTRLVWITVTEAHSHTDRDRMETE
jgi:hypothetical protein